MSRKNKDITGQKFGKLTAIRKIQTVNKATKWLCFCDCGTEILVWLSNLQQGKKTDCGCVSNRLKLGQQFGQLTVISKSKNDKNLTEWLCLCICGNKVLVPTRNLKYGRRTNCGCKIKEQPITGQKFGKLIALHPEQVSTNSFRKNGKIRKLSKYRFKCDCGKEILLYKKDVTKRGLTSCGCDDISFYKSRNTKNGRFGCRKEAAINKKGGVYKFAAFKYKIPYSLNDGDLISLFQGDCQYCGRSASEYGDKNKLHGIDKINPELGYVLDNCVSCCKTCNSMKLDHSLSDFLNHITLIYNNYKKIKK